MRRVLITRPVDQAEELRTLLAARGIASTCVPTVEISASSRRRALARALRGLPGDDGRPAAAWLVLTSANGARAVVERLERDGVAIPPGTRVAAVGPATAEVLRSAAVPVDHVPDRFLTVAIADGLGDVAGRRVVLARAAAASAALADALRMRGALVEEVVAYRAIEGPADSAAPLRQALAERLDGVTFTSGSTVRGFAGLLAGDELARARSLPAFCIGPVTADAARDAGFVPAAVAGEHTAAGLADAVARYFRGSAAA